MNQPFKPVSPIRHRPIAPSYAPVILAELERLEGDNQPPPFSLEPPGAIVRSPGSGISPKDPAGLVHRPRGLAVHQHYPVYATPGFISSERGTATQPAAKARAKFRLWKFKLKLPKFPAKTKKQSHQKAQPVKPKPQPVKSKPNRQPVKPSHPSKPSVKTAGLSGLKLPKPSLSGASFGSIGLGGKSAGKSGGKGSSDNFGDDPIAQLLVKVFITILILIPFIL